MRTRSWGGAYGAILILGWLLVPMALGVALPVLQHATQLRALSGAGGGALTRFYLETLGPRGTAGIAAAGLTLITALAIGKSRLGAVLLAGALLVATVAALLLGVLAGHQLFHALADRLAG
jgi:hypothetical protein